MGSGQELERFADSHNFHILQSLFDKSKDFFTSIAYITPQGVQEYAALGPGYSDQDTDLGTDPLVADCLNAPNRIVSAVRLSRINGPQLVLALSKRSPFGTNMDVEMPGLGGVETLARLRDATIYGPAAATPVVALTAHTTPGFREGLLRRGFNDFVPKPLDMSLRVLVEAHLGHGGQVVALAETISSNWAPQSSQLYS